MGKIIVITLAAALLASCGNSWEMTKKNFQSDYGELAREITVYDSLTGETLWEYSGVGYIAEGSANGNLSIMFHDDAGVIRKADFIGNAIAVMAVER